MAEAKSPKERYWNRVGHVSIMGQDGKMYDYGSGKNAVDFKFNIKKPLGAVRVEASIDIRGLSLETVQFLTWWEPWNMAERLKRRIEVYAGYESTGEKLIFSGYVITAKPDNPPDLWIHIKADNMAYSDSETFNDSTIGTMRFGDIFDKMAEALGLKPELDAAYREKRIKNYRYSGTKGGIVQYLEDLGGIRVYEDNGTLYGVTRSPETVPTSDALVLDRDHGLIGLDSIDFSGIVARARLDSRFARNDWVKVKSSLYPARSNGAYWIYEVDYTGHLRGQEWFVIVSARTEKLVS